MKRTIRILSAVLALALSLSVMLTGCDLWKPTLPGMSNVAATYGDGQEISTGEYLAYLYMNFYTLYYEQGYYYYESYGVDPWEQALPYETGEKDADGNAVTENLTLEDYIVAITKDTIKQQIVLDKMLKDEGLSWIEEEAADIEAEFAAAEPDMYLGWGISDEHFASVYKKVMLNQRGAFFGRYGKGGTQEIKETELKKYFKDNYLSYKLISVPLTTTDEDGNTANMSDKEKKAELDKLNEYLKIAEDKGFEKAMDQYNKDNTAEGEEAPEATKDEDNRQNVDATEMDENLVKAIRSVKVGETKVVEYKTSDDAATPTAILVQRLDINDPKTLYEDSVESIIIALKSDAFTEEVNEAAKKLTISFDEKVLEKCSPKSFLEG